MTECFKVWPLGRETRNTALVFVINAQLKPVGRSWSILGVSSGGDSTSSVTKGSTKAGDGTFEDRDCCWALWRGVEKMTQKIRRAALSVPAGCPSHCPQGGSHTWVGQPFPCPLFFSHYTYTAQFIQILQYNHYLCNNCAPALLGVLQELLQLQLCRFLKFSSS